MKQEFTQAQTIVRKSTHYGWGAETTVDVNGKCWNITTSKRHHNGTIGTHCKIVTRSGNGMISFTICGFVNPKEDFWLNVQTGKCTEKLIRELHAKSLAEMDVKLNAGELPNAEEEYKIEVGQVLFSEGHYGQNRRAIYEIVPSDFGITYKTVYLDGTQTGNDSHIRNYNQKFGIGTYYKEGDVISQEEIDVLLEMAIPAMEAKAQAQKLINEANAEKAAARQKYLSQFQKADRRKTSELVKEHILNTWPTVSKVSCKTDSFSMGDSMDVTYYAPERLPEVDSFIKSFQYGHFDGMTDMYEHNAEQEDIVIAGYILQTYKYCTAHFEQSNALRSTCAEPTTAAAGDIATIKHNEQLNGIEIYFTGKPSEDVISTLKRNGFRAKKRGTWFWYKKVSTSALQLAAKYGTIPASLSKEAIENEMECNSTAGLIQAQEDATYERYM